MDPITGILIPGGLAFTMIAMGFALTPADFRRVVSAPVPVIAGLAAQLLLLPALAFLLVWLWPLPPELAVGVIILAACPGGITSNLLTHLARGDTALSITLTAICSVVGLATVPLIVGIGLEVFSGAAPPTTSGVGSITIGVLVITGVPLALGMAVKAFFPDLADRIEPSARRISAALFALIVIVTFAHSWPAMMAHLAAVGIVVAALNLGTMGCGYGIATLFDLRRPQRLAVVLECGLQNAAIGIFVGGTLLGSQVMMIPSLIYAVVMNITTIALLALMWFGAGRQKHSEHA
jgi:BASS family bile acid:Na+ symporter